MLDIVKVVDGEPKEKERRQDGDHNRQDAQVLHYGQTLDWSRRWPQKHLKGENIFLSTNISISNLLIVIQLLL